MFKKRVKQSITKMDENMFTSETIPSNSKKNDCDKKGHNLMDKRAYVEIPLSAMFRKAPEEEEIAKETKAEIEKNRRINLQLEKNYQQYDDSEQLIRKKAQCKSGINVDFNPSVCKDYHDNGYCTWGNSCLFAHDRTEYKKGWELDKEWEEEQLLKLKNERKARIEKTKTDECFICKKKEYKLPVETNCQHIFCEECIIRHFRSSKNCPICKVLLNGIFNILKVVSPSSKASLESEINRDRNFNHLSDYIQPIKRHFKQKDNKTEDYFDIEPVFVNQKDFEDNLI